MKNRTTAQETIVHDVLGGVAALAGLMAACAPCRVVLTALAAALPLWNLASSARADGEGDECEPGWILDESPSINSPNPRYDYSKLVQAALWDPDGAGPAQTELVVALGPYTTDVDGQPSPIQTWDGRRWRVLGHPKELMPVQAITSYQGDVVAWVYGNPSKFVRWNGTVWADFAPGLNGAGFGYQLFEFNEELWAIGNIQVPGIEGNRLFAKWNGASWEAPDSSLTNIGSSFVVFQESLYASGTLTSDGESVNAVMRWDGSDWEVVGRPDGRVSSMAVYQDRLTVAGGFSSIDGVQAVRMAQWDGNAWSSCADSAAYPGGNLVAFDGRLYSCSRGGNGVSGLAFWDGSTWSAVNVPRWSIGPTPNSFSFSNIVYDDMLVLVGRSGTSSPSDVRHAGIVGWDGTSWQLLHDGYDNLFYIRSPRFFPTAATVHNGNAVFAGPIMYDDACVLMWTGSRWSLLGHDKVNAKSLLSFQGNIVAGGGEIQTTSGPQSLAIWHGSVWKPLGFGKHADVLALTEYHGEIVAGGSFTQVGEGDEAMPIRGVARWDGKQWHSIGNTISGQVDVLTVYKGELIAGGYFTVDGSEPPVRNLARWNGEVWAGFPDLITSEITYLEIYQDNLLAGYRYGVVLASLEELPFAQWDGQSWSLPAGISTWHYYRLSDMAVYGNELVIAGEFSVTVENGDYQTNNMMRWDGRNWRTIPGAPRAVYGMAAADDALHIAGTFREVNGQPALGMVRWGCPPAPEPEPCIADFNGVNGATVQDIFDFLTAWLGGDESADVNHVNGVSVQDLFDFLTAWIHGC